MASCRKPPFDARPCPQARTCVNATAPNHVVEAGEQAVAVELDFADPALALRRRLGDRSQFRRLLARQCPPHRAGSRALGAAAGLLGGRRRRRHLVLEGERVDAGPFVLVVPLDEEPGVLARALAAIEPDQVEAAVEPGAVQHEWQVALAHGGLGIADRLPAAAVPGLHFAGAVLSLRDAALEVGVVERMVLDMRGEPPVGGIERQASQRLLW